jgi:CRISPR-associated protein Cst1
LLIPRRKFPSISPHTSSDSTLQEIQNRLKQIKHHEQIEEVQTCIDEYFAVISEKDINDKLTINYVKSVVLSPYFGQVSFLNVAKNSLDMQGHIDTFYKDYITPVQNDILLLEKVATSTTIEEILAFVDDYSDYPPFRLLKKAWKKSTLEQVRDYVKTEMMDCSLITGQPGFHTFEEMVFSPLGVSNKNAANFFWNLDQSQPLPISSLARLLLFCIPIGATMYYRKDGWESQGETRLYAGFVHTDATFEEILQKNESFRQHKKHAEPFEKIVSHLVSDVKRKGRYVTDHLFFLELSANYQSKRTLLDYYHIPRYLAEYFRKYADKLESIKPMEYREQFIRHSLQGIDTNQVIFKYLKYVIQNGRSGVGAYVAVRERSRIRCFKKGVEDMEKQDKRVYAIFRSGQEIRNEFERSGKKKEDQDHYVSGADKKIAGIAYRLLNAAKAGNQKGFMDTLLRVHMSAGKPVSPVFLNILHERDVDFATVANAFIAGLLSDKEINKETNKEEAQEEVVQ